MPINVKCQCGKTLKVDDKHRGKKAKCPACGNVLLVEESGDTGVQAEAPKKGRPGDDAVAPGKPKKRADPDDGEGSGERKPLKKPAKSNMMMYMLGGGALLGLLGCCCTGIGGFAIYWFFFRGVDEDLSYVHDGVAGFASFRVAEVWKNNAFQDGLKKLPGGRKEMDDKIKEIEEKLGHKIDDLERVNVIVRSADLAVFGGDAPDMIITFKTSRAMDKKKILDTIVKESKKEKEKEVKFDGGTMYVIGGGGRDAMVLYWPSDKVLIMSPREQTLKDAHRDSKKTAKHPALVRGLKAAQSGSYWFVMAVDVKKSWIDKMGPEAIGKAPNTAKTNGLIITSGLTARESTFEAILTFENSDTASKAKPEISDLVGTLKVGLKGGKNAAAEKALASIKVDQRGSEVIISGKSDLDVDAIQFNPFGGGFGAGPGFEDKVVAEGPGPKVGPGPLGAGARVMHVNNMKQVGLAMHVFHDANKALPNHAIRHPQSGVPLLSWRVAILPYIEEGALFAQIRLNEPWNSPHNSQFHTKMPRIYQVPGKPNDGTTHLQVFHGDKSAFPKTKKAPGATMAGDMRLSDFTDGTSNTFMVAEAATLVNWMAPDDIPFQMGDAGLTNRVGNYWGNNTFHAIFADGTVRAVPRNMTAQRLQAFVTPNAGDVTPPF